MSDLTSDIIAARKKMEEKFGNVKLGGKGTQKKKKIATHKTQATQDKKIVAIAKKSGARNLGETAEINIFKDDNNVIHFKKPKLEYSAKEKVTFITGFPENKTIKDLLPGIIRQLGPKQLGFIKEYAETLKNNPAKQEEKPDLVEDFEEVSKQN